MNKKILCFTTCLIFMCISLAKISRLEVVSPQYEDESFVVSGTPVSVDGIDITATMKMTVTLRNASYINSSSAYVKIVDHDDLASASTTGIQKSSSSNRYYVQWYASVDFCLAQSVHNVRIVEASYSMNA